MLGMDQPFGLHRNSEQAVFQIREWQMSQDKQIFGFEQCGEVLIVTALGSFMEFRDNDIRNGYNEAYRQLSEPGIRHLLVDFSAMQYFGSTFVGILIRLAKKARANKGDAALCHMSDNMKDMLKTLMLLENPKIDFSWVAYPDRAAALQALSLH
jgi:anti-anti-sigma factor